MGRRLSRLPPRSENIENKALKAIHAAQLAASPSARLRSSQFLQCGHTARPCALACHCRLAPSSWKSRRQTAQITLGSTVAHTLFAASERGIGFGRETTRQVLKRKRPSKGEGCNAVLLADRGPDRPRLRAGVGTLLAFSRLPGVSSGQSPRRRS